MDNDRTPLNRPSIAIVMATYNGEATLDKALDSLIRQTDCLDQIVVIDGASEDGTRSIIERRQDILSYWASEPDLGIYDAWNKALPHVTSDWVLFMGCDDWLACETVVERWREALVRADPSNGILYSSVQFVNANGRLIETSGKPWEMIRAASRHRMTILFSGTMIRRTLFEVVGGFSTEYRISGDFDWFLRATRMTEPKFVDFVSAYMSDGGVSGATSSQITSLLEDRRVLLTAQKRLPLGWFWRMTKALTKARIAVVFGPKWLIIAVDLYRVITNRSRRGAAR